MRPNVNPSEAELLGPSQSVCVASVELCFLLVLTDAPAFPPPPHCWLLLLTSGPVLDLLLTGFSLSTMSGLLLSKVAPLCCFLVSFVGFFLFLKLHQGTRTHAQTPRRPVPPPKPRRSKKGVSRCRLQPSTSVL